MTIFFFSRKEAKALVLLHRGSHYRNSAKPTQGVWGLAPRGFINSGGAVFCKQTIEADGVRVRQFLSTVHGDHDVQY
jgi:hypothetical protein